MHHLGDILNHKEIMEQEERGCARVVKRQGSGIQNIFRYINSLSVMTQRWQVLLPGTRDMDVGQGNGLRQRGQSHG